MGTDLENLCSLLCIFILHVSILTHASPSPPLLTFGARHSHGCGRLYACSPPGGTQCPPFAVHVTVINTTTTTTTTTPRTKAVSHAETRLRADEGQGEEKAPSGEGEVDRRRREAAEGRARDHPRLGGSATKLVSSSTARSAPRLAAPRRACQ